MGDRGRGWGGGRVKRKVRRYYKTVYPACVPSISEMMRTYVIIGGGGVIIYVCVCER